jgi:hypothetical protein
MALLIVNPGFSLCSNPGLKLANAFGVKFKLRLPFRYICGFCAFCVVKFVLQREPKRHLAHP